MIIRTENSLNALFTTPIPIPIPYHTILRALCGVSPDIQWPWYGLDGALALTDSDDRPA